MSKRINGGITISEKGSMLNRVHRTVTFSNGKNVESTQSVPYRTTILYDVLYRQTVFIDTLEPWTRMTAVFASIVKEAKTFRWISDF